MMTDLNARYQQDQSVWDRCSGIYEQRIVGGHPDIHAYEAFEETLLDHLLLHLARTLDKRISVVDLGCGSGRLLLRLMAQTTPPDTLTRDKEKRLRMMRSIHPDWAWNPQLQSKLRTLTGVDFSRAMLTLAKKKMSAAGLSRDGATTQIQLIRGSAFDPVQLTSGAFPVVVCLINSIGVMQGIEGAKKLFQSIRQTVDQGGGIGLISCFCRENIGSHGLGQYESTMDVSGPPIWLKSDWHDLAKLLFVPRAYRRFDDTKKTIDVAVYETDGRLIDECHTLRRIPKQMEEMLRTGKILTHQGYESRWYSKKEIASLISNHWGKSGWQTFGSRIDPLRARACQLAWYDPNGHARRWFKDLTGDMHRA